MLSKIYRKFEIVLPLIILGFLICGPLTDSSFAAGNRIGFLNIQKAVSSTKDWKSKTKKFKADFNKEKKRIKIKEQKIKKNVGKFEQTKFCSGPRFKKEKRRRV